MFITWRQKDPKEPDLGLYGKIAYGKPIDNIIDTNDIYLMDIREDIKYETNQTPVLNKAKFKRPHIAHNKNILNSVWTGEFSKFQK